MISLGVIPQDFAITDVFPANVAAMPKALVGRRATFDELIWDEDSGFAQSWVDRSSVGSDGAGGFTFLLQRRAYSAAGLAIFALEGGSGSGGGAVASVFGRTGVVEAETFDYNTSQIANVASVGDGGFGTLSGALEALQSAIADGDASAEAYRGHTTGLLTYGTSFASLPAKVTTGAWVDDAQSGVSRSGADLAVTQGGFYRLSLLAIATTSVPAATFTIRATVVGVQIAGSTTPVEQFAANYVTLECTLWLDAGTSIAVECKMSAAGSWGTAAPAGAANAQLTLVRFGSL